MSQVRESEVSAAYARLMRVLFRATFSLIIVSCLAYLAGLLPRALAPRQVAGLWSLPPAAFLREAGPAGAAPAETLLSGSIILLAVIPLACYLRIIPLLRNSRAFLSLAIAAAQALVLLLSLAAIR